MRFRNIILAYFVIGVVMFGGGAVNWENAGLAKWFIENDSGDVGVEDQTVTKLQGVGGAIQSVINDFGGPLVLVWNLVIGLLTFLNWPVVALATNNAPPILTILLGGGLTVGFYMSLVGLVMSGS